MEQAVWPEFHRERRWRCARCDVDRMAAGPVLARSGRQADPCRTGSSRPATAIQPCAATFDEGGQMLTNATAGQALPPLAQDGLNEVMRPDARHPTCGGRHPYPRRRLDLEWRSRSTTPAALGEPVAWWQLPSTQNQDRHGSSVLKLSACHW